MRDVGEGWLKSKILLKKIRPVHDKLSMLEDEYASTNQKNVNKKSINFF